MQLEVKNLQVSYGKIKALHGIDFSIDRGEIVCIIGANGAGKSTTLRAISRLLPADNGSVINFEGKSVDERKQARTIGQIGLAAMGGALGIGLIASATAGGLFVVTDFE